MTAKKAVFLAFMCKQHKNSTQYYVLGKYIYIHSDKTATNLK